MTIIVDTTVFSGVAWDLYSQHIRGAVFGQLVRLAQPHMTHFQSDLYYDALWMEENITGPAKFYWSFNETGTVISDTPANHRKYLYKVELYAKDTASPSESEDYTWKIRITEV